MQQIKQYIVTKDIDKVNQIFSNLKIYGAFHPLIIDVKEFTNKKGKAREFRITEQPYAWLPWKISYNAQLRYEYSNLSYIITGIPFLSPKIKYSFESLSDQKTQITFNLKVEGLYIAKKLLLNKMIKAQDDLMHSINNKNGII